MKQIPEHLKRFVHEHVGDVTIALFVIFVLLATGRAYQRWSSLSELTHIKTTVELASVVLGIFLGGIAAIAGYRRFFKGRTFSERAKLDLSSHPVCELDRNELSEHDQTDGEQAALLHAVDVSIENRGSTTIWIPKIGVRARHLASDEEFPTYGKPEKIETAVAPLSVSAIEPGETIYYHYRFLIPKKIIAFRVSAELSTSRGNIWHRSMTLKNGLNTSSPDQKL